MADKLSFHTLPIELIYRILDHLAPLDILVSIQDVCIRLNAVIHTYYPYQVSFVHAFYSHIFLIDKVVLLLSADHCLIPFLMKSRISFVLAQV
jgi:hypothetical protein